MSNQMQPLKVLRDYCGNGNPVIVEEFSDRWRRQSYRKRASGAWLRKLRSEGITHIAVEVAPRRVADFTVAEVLRGGH